MSYLVLARKYRPRTFADMVGQENVTATLRGAIAENRVGHAYLFCGPRGTGKTTTARILAKALNCESGPTADPCGTCERCVAADDGSEIDIVEIDAASNTGVDDVRLLRDQVAYAPMRARFKVYIIDEVHMLSRGAFNAFLKTLEEPPAHVKFLFATTDPQKVPETILSRCQVLKLSPIPETVIASRLDHVFGIENVRAEPGVSREIARRARGGMRDALSMADQLLSLVGSEPKVEDVSRLSEGGAFEELERLVELVMARDRRGLLGALPRNEGGEGELLSALLEHVRAMLVALVTGPDTPLVVETKERVAAMRARAETIGLDRLQSWLEELLIARERMRVLPVHARAVLEVTLLDLCREETAMPLSQIASRLLALEQRLGAAPGVGMAAAPAPRASAPAAGSTGASPIPAPSASSSVAPGASAIAAPSASASLSPSASSSPAPSGSFAASPAASAPARTSGVVTPAPPPSARTASVGRPPLPASDARSASSAAPDRSTDTLVRPADAPVVAGGDSPSSRDVVQPAPRPTPRVTAPPVDTHVATDRPRPMISGTSDAWARFLDVLSTTSASLSDTLRARGKLADLSNGRALVQFSNLRDAERTLVHDPRNHKAAVAAFHKALGTAVQVVFEDQSATRAQKDAFTAKVAEFFGGQVEDGG